MIMMRTMYHIFTPLHKIMKLSTSLDMTKLMENFIFSAVRVHIDKYISFKMKKEKHASSIFMKNKTKKPPMHENIYYCIYYPFKRSGISKTSDNVSMNYTFI